MLPVDVREAADPIRGATQEWGEATQTENALRALTSIGGGETDRNGNEIVPRANPNAPPVSSGPLLNLVAPGTPLPYSYGMEQDAGAPNSSWTTADENQQAGPSLGDIGGFLGNTVANVGRRAFEAGKQAWEGFSEGNRLITEGRTNPGTAIDEKALGEESGKALGGTMGVAGSVFSPITDTARRAVVESDPVMKQMYDQTVAALPQGKRDGLAEADAANAVFDRTKDALANVASDPNASSGDRLVAGIVSGLMQTQELAEFGAPSMVARLPKALTWLRGTAPKVAEAAGLAEDVKAAPDVAVSEKPATPSTEMPAAAEAPKEPTVSPLGQKILDALNAPEAQTTNLGEVAQASMAGSRQQVIRRVLRWATAVDENDPVQVKKYAQDGRTILGHIDDMIDTIQNESSRGMPTPTRFLNELLDARSSVSDTLAQADDARKLALANLKAATSMETAASADLRKASRTESSTSQDARTAELGVLKTDIQARSAGTAADATSTQKVDAASGKVDQAAQKVDAANLSAEDRIAQAKAATEQRISDLRAKADDISLSNVDREQARMDAVNESIQQRRQAIQEQRQTSADRVSFSGDDAPETGYVAPDDTAVFDRSNIHVSKQESPLVGEVLAQTIRDAEAAGQDLSKSPVSFNTIAGEMVRKFGEVDSDALIDKVQKRLQDSPRKGEQAALYQAADKSITRLAENTREAFAADPEGGKVAAARLIQFIEDFREAVGESARATGSRRMINREKSADLIQGTSTLRTSKARLRDADARLARLDKETEVQAAAHGERAAAIAEANAKRDALLVQREAAIRDSAAATEASIRGQINARLDGIQKRLDTVEALRTKLEAQNTEAAAKWEARVQTALDDADKATQAHAAAQQAVSDAAKKLQDAIIQKRAAKMTLTPEKMKVILQLDPENVAGFVRALRDQDIVKRGELLNTYVLTNMFGGAGQLANTIGNAVSLASTELATRPLSSITAKIPGYRVKVGGANAVIGGETEAALAGLYSSLMDATQFAVKTIAHGEDVGTAARRGLLDITTPGASALGASGRPAVEGLKGLPLEWPRRLLTANDGFNRILGTSAEAAARVYREAYIEAGGGKAGSRAAAKAVADFKENPSIKQLEAANEYSGRETFNEPADRGSLTGKIVSVINHELLDTGLRPGSWLIPVVRFGLNAAAASVRLSGGGLLSGLRTAAKGREAAALGQDAEALMLGRKAAQEAAQGLIGVSMLAGGWTLMDQGLLTGSRPTKPKELAQWNKEGRQEQSLNILGHWVPLSLLGPPAAPLLLATLMRDQSDVAQDNDRLERAAMALGNFATSIPVVSGTYDLLGFGYNMARNGWNSQTESYAARVGTRFAPYSSTARALTPFFDDTVRSPEDMIQRIISVYPGLSSTVPAKTDPYTGEPIKRTNNGLTTSEKPAQDATTQELIAQGHQLSAPGNTLASITLTPAEQNQYSRLAEQARKSALDAVVASPDYTTVKDPKQRQAMLSLADARGMDKARLAFARQMVDAAATPEATQRALGVLLVEGGTQGGKALALADYAKKITSQIAQALDAARKPNADGVYPPTVADYLKAAPLVQKYLEIPPFRVGDEAEWQKVVAANALRAQITNDLQANAKAPVDPRSIDAELRKRNPAAANLIAKYSDTRMADPRRKAIVDANPWLDSFVASYRYTSKR